MGYIAPHTYVTAEELRSSTFNNEIVNNVKWLGKVPAFGVAHSAIVTSTAGTWVQIPYNTMGYQSYTNGWDSTNHRFAVDRAGWWCFVACLWYGPTGTQIVDAWMAMNKNSGAAPTISSSHDGTYAPQYWCAQTIAVLTNCVVGDYFSVWGLQNGSGAMQFGTTSNYWGFNYFRGWWVRDT